MNKLILVPFIFCLTGCVGTMFLNRDYEKDKPYPSLHSVPDRPEAVDYTVVNQEIAQEENDQEQMLKFNKEWREKYIEKK